eukprot:2412348-Rhodomonas_salina.1
MAPTRPSLLSVGNWYRHTHKSVLATGSGTRKPTSGYALWYAATRVCWTDCCMAMQRDPPMVCSYVNCQDVLGMQIRVRGYTAIIKCKKPHFQYIFVPGKRFLVLDFRV